MLLVTAAGAGLVGCTSPAEPSADDADTTSVTSATTGETGTAADELDLREANVVAVAVGPAAGGHRFDVTLHHDDDGEEGYANWWQVETLDGERLGRRDLAHPHGTREFTRSATVSVPDGTTCVVVRGHDRTHGYGGRVILVNVATGATTAVRQGPEREPMDGRACQ